MPEMTAFTNPLRAALAAGLALSLSVLGGCVAWTESMSELNRIGPEPVTVPAEPPWRQRSATLDFCVALPGGIAPDAEGHTWHGGPQPGLTIDAFGVTADGRRLRLGRRFYADQSLVCFEVARGKRSAFAHVELEANQPLEVRRGAWTWGHEIGGGQPPGPRLTGELAG